MTSRLRWSNQIRRFLAPWLREKVPGTKSKPSLAMEALEDRTVPAYVPALGFGEADGYPLADPGLVTDSINFTPSDPLSLTGNFYESVNAANSDGLTLSGVGGANLYNTEGPVITVNGGKINLGSGIVYGRASSYLGTITPGNELLVNNGGTAGVMTGDALTNLSVTVDAGSQLLLGDPALIGPFNTFGSNMTLGGSGVGGAGAVQSVNGTEIVSGSIFSASSVTVGASSGATLILNGAVNGVRSATAFSNFSTTGGGTVIMDNVFPVATVSAVTPGTTSNPLMTFRVSLSEIPQDDLTMGSLTVTNGTVTGLTKIDDLTYDFTVTSTIPAGASGSVTAQVTANTVIDRAYLGNLASNLSTVVLDRQAPTASGNFPDIGASLASATQASISIQYTDGSGVGINPASIAASNLLVTDSNGQTLNVGANPSFNAATGVATYSILPGTNWGTYAQNGAVVVDVAVVAGGVTDLVGNGIEAAVVGSFTVDTNSPVLTVNGGFPIEAANGPNVITVTSDKIINNFDPSKFTATNGVVTAVNKVDDFTLEVTVNALPGAIQQIILLNIAQDAVTDDFGNLSKVVSPSLGFTFDTLKPTVEFNTPAITINASNPAEDNFVDFNVFDPSFNNVLGSGVDISSILLSSIVVRDPNGTQILVTDLFKDDLGGIATIPASQFPGGTWAGAVQGTYTITLQNFVDNAGNQVNPTQIGSFIVATTPPSVNLSANPTTNIDGLSKVTIAITTVGDTTISGLTLSDFSVVGSAVLSNLQQTGPNQYTVDLTPTAKNAAITLSLPAGTVQDNAGNANTASNNLNLTFATTNPLPSFSGLQASPSNDSQFNGVVHFTEAVNLSSGLLRLSLSDFNISAGNVASFSSSDTTDGINFPFTITFTDADQFTSFNIKANIGTAQAAGNLPNSVGSPANITLVVSDPTAGLVAPIAPVNSSVDPMAQIVFQVQFTSGLNIGLDFSNVNSALEILKGGATLSYFAESIDPVTGIVTYVIEPPAGGWTDATSQGSWAISILDNQISDLAGNFVPGADLGTFAVRTGQPNSSFTFPGAQDPDYTLVWINASSPNQIVVKLSPTDVNGGPLSPGDLDTSIVPTIANFQATGFNVVAVSSSWIDAATAPYILVTLEPIADVVGDTNSVGPASLVVKANAFYDIYGNGNTEVDPLGILQNGFGFISMVGIDRVAPIYTTTGITPQQLGSSQLADPVVVKISYSDVTSGVNLDTYNPANLILTLNGDSTTNVAIITGEVDPQDSSTYIYTLSPISGTWADGTYTLRFTPNHSDTVFDNASNVLFDPASANGIPPVIVTNGGTPVTFVVDANNPVVSSAELFPAVRTNVTPLLASVTFSEVIQGFTAGSLALQGATLTSPITTNDGLHYTFELTPTSDQVVVSYTVLANSGITDTFGNPLDADVTSNEVIFDAVGPTGTLTQAPVNINIANSAGNTSTFQVTYSDPAGIDPTSITTANYTVDNGATITNVSFDPVTGIATYTVTGNGATWSTSNQGLYTITPATDPANLPKDSLGNVATLPAASFSVDTVAPTVTSIGFTDNDPTNAQVLTVEIEFSKPVTFGDAGTDFENLFAVTNGVVSGITQIDATHFSVTVNPVGDPAGVRLVTFQVKEGAATDDAGNPNPASAIASITFDNLGPQLEVEVQGLTNNATNQQIVTVIVNVDPASAYNFFNQPEAGIVLTNATYVSGSFTPVSGVNGQYQFQIMATNPGLVTVGMAADTFDDDLGNGNVQTTVEYQYRVALTVQLSSPDVVQGGTTTQNTLSFSALFNGAIVDFDPATFFTVSNATITNLTQDPVNPALFTFTVTPTAGGPVSVQVNAGTATDDLGQTNEASTPFTFTYDQQIVVTSTLSTNATPITSQKTILVTLDFSQAVTGLDASNFLSKFTVTGGTLDPNYFVANSSGTSFQVLLRPNGVMGSNVPVPVTLQFNGGSVTPSNQPSNVLALTYITQTGVLGLGTGGLAYLDKADGTVLTVNVFPGFTGGVRVASDNYAITGSDTLDLLAGAGPGGGPNVKVINGNTGAVASSFYAFSASFTGGVFVASGDVNGDGFNDFVVAAGPGGGPHVKVFSGNPADFVNGKPVAFASFFAYASAFQGGVTVAVADVNGDGYGDVITGAGSGGSPHVIVFSGASLALNQKLALASYYSGSPTSTAGVFVGAGDLGADGTIQIFTGTGAGVVGIVNIVTLEQQGTDNYFVVNPSLTHTIQPYGNFTGGVRVSTVDSYLLTGPGKGGGPNIRVFDPLNDYTLVDSFFFPDNPDYLGGVFIG